MNRSTLLPLILIGNVAVWAWDSFLDQPTWARWLVGPPLFLIVAIHIWRGRAWR